METLARSANRGSISTGGYEIANSFVQEYNSTRSVEVIYGGFSGSPPTTTKGTVSFWFKWGALNGGAAVWKLWNVYNSQVSIMPEGGTYDSSIYVAVNNESVLKLVSTAKFRDTSAWYHICAVFDTTLSTASDRVKIYINGVRITDWSTANYPSQNADLLLVKENTKHFVGHDVNVGKPYGYYAEMYYIHNQAKDVTDFGEFDSDTGIWKPIEYTGTFGSYGYHWDFSNASNLAEDQSGNDASTGQMTCSAFNVTSSMQSTDTPTNNFCVVNAHSSFLLRDATGISEGATRINHTNENTWCGAITTMGVTKGKWYWEVVINDFDDQMLGVTTFTGDTGSNTHPYQIDHTWNIYGGGSSGSYWISHINGTTTGNSSNRGAVWSAGSYIGVALDMDNSTLSFYHNGTLDSPNNSSIDISSLTALGHPLIPYVNIWRNAMWLNFGGYWSYPTAIVSGNTDANGYGNFEYAPPSGYYALCSKNLAEFG